MRRPLLLAACALALAGCARLENVGKEPAFSPVGQPMRPAVAAPGAARTAIAAGPPADVRRGQEQASLWRSGPASLFGDRRASRTGDILTVLIEIDDRASISNSSARSRGASDNLGVPQLFGIPQRLDRLLPSGASAATLADLSSSMQSSGQGSVERNESIELRLAATVVDVLPNRHLVIQGSQEVRVNYELRDLQIAGIVRPEDISRQNTITYDKVAGARIAYGGRGQITDVQQPRYGQQVLDVILPY